MNETRRDELVEQVGEKLVAVYSIGANLERVELTETAMNIIALVKASAWQEFEAAMLGAEAVGAVSAIEISALNDSVNAAKVKFGKAWDLNTDNPRAIVDLRNPYKMSIPVALAAIAPVENDDAN